MTPNADRVTDRGAASQREFSLPPRLVRSKSVTLSGLHLVPDILRRRNDQSQFIERVAGTRVSVSTLAGHEMDETTLGGDQAQFSLRLSNVPDEILTLRFQSESAVLNNGAHSMVAQLLIDYDALRTPNR